MAMCRATNGLFADTDAVIPYSKTFTQILLTRMCGRRRVAPRNR